MIYTIVILDYCLNEVRVYHFNKMNKPKDPEKWIEEHDLNWSDDQCYYMCGDNTAIKYLDNKSGECLMEDLI